LHATVLHYRSCLHDFSHLAGGTLCFHKRAQTDRQAEDRAGHRTYYVEGFGLIGHDSFAGIENADKSHRPVAPFGAIVQADGPSADILAGSRSLIAVFRQAFSYRSEQAIQTLRKARYCQVSIYQVHPGSESDFAELVKSRWIAFDISYHVPSGAASGTYVFLAPLASLKMLDDTPAKAYAENIAAEAMKTGGLTREHLLFRVEPSLSWVSDDFASADPEFWHGKAKTQ
jgi:hypothetical protein